MRIEDLEQNLRKLVRQRIAAGQLSGSELARLAGFKQAHISNFLSERRGLSVEAFDRVLTALRLNVRDLLPGGVTAAVSGNPREYDEVPLVAHEVAHRPQIPSFAVLDLLKFKKSFLRRLRPLMAGNRDEWTRFILLKANADAEVAMSPRILSGAAVLVDRHYNELEPYRRRGPNLYAVKKDAHVLMRYVEVRGGQMLLRPANPEAELDVLPISGSRGYADAIIGRICHVGMEL